MNIWSRSATRSNVSQEFLFDYNTLHVIFFSESPQNLLIKVVCYKMVSLQISKKILLVVLDNEAVYFSITR